MKRKKNFSFSFEKRKRRKKKNGAGRKFFERNNIAIHPPDKFKRKSPDQSPPKKKRDFLTRPLSTRTSRVKKTNRKQEDSEVAGLKTLLPNKKPMSLPFSLHLVLLVSFLSIVSSTKKNRQDGKNLTFALVSKQVTNNPFFDHVRDGCYERAQQLEGVTCLYLGPESENAVAQAEIIESLINSGKVDGISFSVIEIEIATMVISKSLAAGIPIITFDSDAPESERLATVGTNNYAFGEELGKVLTQLNPQGGYYGMISTLTPNVRLREDGVRNRLSNSKWIEVEGSAKNCQDEPAIAIDQMWEYAADPRVKAIIPVGGWPMYLEEQWKNFTNFHDDITLVVGDTLPVQVKAINQGRVNGLMGQLPFEMGQLSVNTLLSIVESEEFEPEVLGTSLLEMLQFPLVLPFLNVDMNYLGDLVIVGYVFFGIIATLAVGFILWATIFRLDFVVRAAQPFFLVMICIGTLILASTIFPLSIDDENHSQSETDAACMAVPWCLSFGFAITFSALFAKTWRVNKIFNHMSGLTVVKVSTGDVLAPTAGLILANAITLICWTAISPLKYERRDHDGTDDWNRIISTYGTCTSDDGTKGWVPYLVVLIVINFSILLFALKQAYEARSVSVAFSESRYITLVMILILQVFVIGIPLLFLVFDQPRDYYVVWLCLIFVSCLAILLLIFVPKLRNQNSNIFTEQSGNESQAE